MHVKLPWLVRFLDILGADDIYTVDVQLGFAHMLGRAGF